MGGLVSKKYINYYVTEPTDSEIKSRQFLLDHQNIKFIKIENLSKNIDGLEQNIMIKLSKDGKKNCKIFVQQSKNEAVIKKLKLMGYKIIEIS